MDKNTTKNLQTVLEAIKKIKRDCFNLKKDKDLTEYGEGQLDIICIIFKELGLKN